MFRLLITENKNATCNCVNRLMNNLLTIWLIEIDIKQHKTSLSPDYGRTHFKWHANCAVFVKRWKVENLERFAIWSNLWNEITEPRDLFCVSCSFNSVSVFSSNLVFSSGLNLFNSIFVCILLRNIFMWNNVIPEFVCNLCKSWAMCFDDN